jgi:hypothetical protein
MKNTATFFLLFLLGTTLQSQSITEKDVDGFGSFKAKQFKNAPKKIYINSFNVYFQVFGNARAGTSGGEMLGTVKGATNVAMGVFLDGVDNSDFLEITNNVYERYVQNLKALGYEIITADEAGKTEELNGWIRKEGGQINSAQSLGFVKVTPANYAYYVIGEKNSGKEKKGVFANTGVLSKELGDAVIADVNMTFYFVQMKTYDNEFIGYSKVSGKPNFHMPRLLGDVKNQVLTSANYAFGKNLTATEAAVHTTIKKGIWSDKPVFDADIKFKESAAAGSKPIPDYASVIFVNNANLKASHYMPCDPALYKQETERMMNEFLDISLTRLSANLE